MDHPKNMRAGCYSGAYTFVSELRTPRQLATHMADRMAAAFMPQYYNSAPCVSRRENAENFRRSRDRQSHSPSQIPFTKGKIQQRASSGMGKVAIYPVARYINTRIPKPHLILTSSFRCRPCPTLHRPPRHNAGRSRPESSAPLCWCPRASRRTHPSIFCHRRWCRTRAASDEPVAEHRSVSVYAKRSGG